MSLLHFVARIFLFSVIGAIFLFQGGIFTATLIRGETSEYAVATKDGNDPAAVAASYKNNIGFHLEKFAQTNSKDGFIAKMTYENALKIQKDQRVLYVESNKAPKDGGIAVLDEIKASFR